MTKIEDIENIVANNLKIARRIRDVTLKDLSCVLGVTYQQVQKYETGKNSISIGKLLVIANHLNLPITFFFEEFKLNRRVGN